MNDKDIGTIAICAVRYALGRQTYMPGIVQGFIMRHPEIMDERTRCVMLRDINEADRVTEHKMSDGSIMRIDHLGDTKIDRPGWERLRDWLAKRQNVCGSCKHWEHGDPHRCMNRDGVFYGDLMGPDEKCEEWAKDGNVNRKGSEP